jgi:hypothetical protein
VNRCVHKYVGFERIETMAFVTKAVSPRRALGMATIVHTSNEKVSVKHTVCSMYYVLRYDILVIDSKLCITILYKYYFFTIIDC